jgi:hypothetical protein
MTATRTNRAWVATRKGLFELQRGGRGGAGGGWRVGRVSFLAEPVSMLLPPADGAPLLAALNLGHFGVKLHASDDAGASWREVAAPAYPPQPEGAPGPAWTLGQVWSLERGHDAGTVWAGTIPGGLFRSADGGTSWSLVHALWDRPERLGWFGGGNDAPGIHSICPHPTRPGELLLGISCGGAWVTPDEGASWELRASGMTADYLPPETAGDPNTQDPHRIVRCTAQPEVLWCQHHCGIWRSGDNARSWQRVEGVPLSAFGFAVAAHPHDPDTAWFVPAVVDQQRVPVGAALAVNVTHDGGRSFRTLRDGLPQADCYDLVYRHGLAVADDGTSLLMGSTTGHLWSSDDGGAHWQAVALHLPPIYALRFG